MRREGGGGAGKGGGEIERYNKHRDSNPLPHNPESRVLTKLRPVTSFGGTEIVVVMMVT